MKKYRKTPIFIPYNQNEQTLFPPTWDEFIPASHPVRIVNRIIEEINISPLLSQYGVIGRRNYNPKMLLKLIVYGYICNIYSSRKIEELAKENIHCLWLTGMNMPDHNTINRFRSERLKEVLKEIFGEVVKLLIESGQVSLEEVYLDGTKIEANANKYTFVWGKAIKSSRARVGEQLEELWKYAEGVAKEELRATPAPDFKAIDTEKVKETIEKIDSVLKKKAIDKKVRQKINYAKRHWPANLEKYERQEKELGKRNSYSKTDHDATFMRMKEDSMLNGQLKAGYNVQISTNKQIIMHYSIHQKPTDTTTLPVHITEMEKQYGKVPLKVIADAGYGSEENYEYLKNKGIMSYVKYNMFDKNQRKRKKKNQLSIENLYYNEERDCYYCPMGQKMEYQGEKIRTTENGYKQRMRIYKARNCSGCPMRGACHKRVGNRTIEVNKKLNEYRKEAESLLTSEEGIILRRNRRCDVEPVFGNIKQNKGFKRFLLRGIDKVAIEMGLVSLAHNVKKVYLLESRGIKASKG